LFEWQFTYHGMFTRGVSGDDFRESDVAAVVNRVPRLDQLLKQADQGLSLEVLATKFNLLPKSPNWSSVSDALNVARSNRHNLSQTVLTNSVSVLRNYNQVLSTGLRVIGMALWWARVLGAGRDTPRSLSDGLEILSSELDLSNTTLEQTRELLDSLTNRTQDGEFVSAVGSDLLSRLS